MPDDLPTPELARALFAEMRRDAAAAKVRDGKGEAAVPDGNYADLFKDYPEAPPRERAVDRVWHDFHDLRSQLDPGLMRLLESRGVAPDALRAAEAYLGEVHRDMSRIEAVMVKLVDLAFTPDRAEMAEAAFADILGGPRDETPDDRRAGDVIAELTPDERVQGFRSLIESRTGGTFHMVDHDGEHRLWDDLSPPGKLSTIAADAAYYDVPPEAFVAAAKLHLGDDLLDAGLKVAFRNERELTAVARALPDHNGIDPPTLVEQVKDVVAELEHAQGFIGRQDQGRER